jgi:hypothetical protein
MTTLQGEAASSSAKMAALTRHSKVMPKQVKKPVVANIWKPA